MKAMAQRYGIRIFVETGTFRGAMVQAVQHAFTEIYSIELEPLLFIEARQKFEHLRHVHILNGDSGALLPRLCGSIPEPILFWLDAHYSGEGTAAGEIPLLVELEAIAKRGERDVILIDDARLLGTEGWPALEDIQALAPLDKCPMTIEEDIIRLEPK